MILKEDLINYKRLQNVIKEGEFHIKGEGAIVFGSLFSWYEGIEPVLIKLHQEHLEYLDKQKKKEDTKKKLAKGTTKIKKIGEK